MVVGRGLSAPLGRVVQAKGSIVKRYVHGGRGGSGDWEKRTRGRGEEGVTRFKGCGWLLVNARSSWATLMNWWQGDAGARGGEWRLLGALRGEHERERERSKNERLGEGREIPVVLV